MQGIKRWATGLSRDGLLPLDPKELALDGVTFFMLDYEYAVAQ